MFQFLKVGSGKVTAENGIRMYWPTMCLPELKQLDFTQYDTSTVPTTEKQKDLKQKYCGKMCKM